jgi:hypothetical protein
LEDVHVKTSLFAVLLLLLSTGNVAMATEEPAFTAIVDDGVFQVREYPALAVAETRVAGDRGRASGTGFRILAGYIFGGNTRRESIAMTAPVLQSPPSGETIAMTAPVSQTEAGDAWVVRFMMPSGYTMETLPKPNDPRVTLTMMPPARVAVVRFSGWANDREFQRRRAELEQWMAKRGLRTVGPASYAQYDDPWTPGPQRRNEVMLPVAPITKP